MPTCEPLSLSKALGTDRDTRPRRVPRAVPDGFVFEPVEAGKRTVFAVRKI